MYSYLRNLAVASPVSATMDVKIPFLSFRSSAGEPDSASSPDKHNSKICSLLVFNTCTDLQSINVKIN